MGKRLTFGLGVNANEALKEIVEKSAAAEALGLDYVWVADSPVQLYGPAVASAVASATSKVRIGLGLMSALLYTPEQIARVMKSLWDAYGNRFELCIGAGDKRQLRRVGVHMSPVENLAPKILGAKERIQSILHDTGVVTRIWLGAQGPAMLRLAREFDGVLLNYSRPNMIRWAIKFAGLRKTRGPEMGVYAPAYVHFKPESEILELAKASSAVVALGTSARVLRQFEMYDKYYEIRKAADMSPTVEAILGELPNEVVEDFSVTMTATELPSYLAQLENLGVTHVVFGYPQNYSTKTVKDLAIALRLASRKMQPERAWKSRGRHKT